MTLVWLMAITVTGALVRLTGSGLGCTDWPNCTVNTELDAPGFHSAIEFGNRMISGLAIIPVVAGWMAARRGARSDMTVWFAAMVIGFLGQVVLGMLVTRTELDPRVVLGHFLLSIVLIFLGVVLDFLARVEVTDQSLSPAAASVNGKRRNHALFMLLSATAVIVVGTLVTGSGPHTGSESSGEPIPRLGFDIVDISRTHSLLGWLLVALVVWGLIQHRPQDNEVPWSAHDRSWFYRIGALSIIQGGIGYLQYATGVPVGLVALHIVGAVVLWTVVAWYAIDTIYPGIPDESYRQQPEFVS